jgi:UDP-glucose 4-epimerase
MTRTAIVTGGAGFIGSHLVDSLLGDGIEVVAVDDLSSGRANVRADLEQVDVTDSAELDRVFAAAKPEHVFHLASAAPGDTQRDFEVNVQGTLNVLEAAGRHGAAVVFASAGGALYGDGVSLPAPEAQIPAPISSHGASKWAAEAYVQTWAARSGLPHSVCRLANVYGPRDEAGVVAVFSRLLWEGRAPTLFGYGDPTRDYLHVQDVVLGLRAAAGVGGVFNIGSGVEASTRSVFKLLRDVSGVKLDPVLAPPREGEPARSCLDPSKARRVLGWKPTIPFGTGMRATYRELEAELEATETLIRNEA